MGKMEKVIALYKGDEFLDLGTPFDLAHKFKLSIPYLMWLTTPSAQKREEINHKSLVAIVI